MNKRHYEHTLPNIRGSLSNTYETMDFGDIFQSADEHARSGGRVKKTFRADFRYQQGCLHGRYHRLGCVKGCKDGILKTLDV